MANSVSFENPWRRSTFSRKLIVAIVSLVSGAAVAEGVLDFGKIRERLDAINYNGWVAVESNFQGDADHALVLKRFIAGEPVRTKAKR